MFRVISLAFLVAALLLPSLDADAKCASAGDYLFDVWPPSGELPANGRLVLDVAADDWSVDPFATGTPELVSDAHRVALMEVAIWKTASDRQLVVAPAEPLRVGTTYRLSLAGDAAHLGGELKWTATAMDDESPVWTTSQMRLETTATRYGCGTAQWLEATVDAGDADEPIAVLVERRSKGSSDVERQLVHIVAEDEEDPTSKTIVRVGRGMCGGDFEWTESAGYEVTFSLVDAAGNAAADPAGERAVVFVGRRAGR